jgi:hypothetical protein
MTRARSLKPRLLAAVLLMTSNSAQAANCPAGMSASQIADTYIEVAFTNEVSGPSEHLRKWRRSKVPTLIVTIPSASLFDSANRYRDAINTISDAAKAIQTPIGPGHFTALNADQMEALASKVPPYFDEEVNLITVHIGTIEELRIWHNLLTKADKRAPAVFEGFLRGAMKSGTAFCFGSTYMTPQSPNEIAMAYLYFEDTSELADCAYEDLMQIFGLYGDLPAGSPSMFNDDNVYNRPTEIDEMLWKLHFDSRLRAGMTPAEARQAVLAILDQQYGCQ